MTNGLPGAPAATTATNTTTTSNTTTRTSSNNYNNTDPLDAIVEYDFEEYAVTYGIPETRDPLPYRKAGSVFGGDDEMPILTSAKHDPRLRTVVCRHWLRDLCMKGAACEFLHQYDLAKMPLCRHGDRCKIPDCPFRHISEENRMECAFYKSGFCIHGPFCRYKHAHRDRSELPLVADFTLGLSQMQGGGHHKDGTGGPGGPGDKLSRRPAAKPNEFYKISLCKHYLQGDCPFGDACNFAHGQSELRTFPRKGEEPSDDLEGGAHGVETDSSNPVDYFQGGAAGGGKPCPILEPEMAHYFIVSAATQRDLAISTVRSEWWSQRRSAVALNAGYRSGLVLIFFTVAESRHIQGAALMKSEAVQVIASSSSDEEDDDDNTYCYRFQLEWFRTTEFPIAVALGVAPDLLLPTKGTQPCQDMAWKTGESLMKALWNSPLVTLHESWLDPDDDDEVLPPVHAENILVDFRAPTEPAWPVLPGPGFIFGCSSDTMDECLGRGIFGLPKHMEATAAAAIALGSTIFLFNVTDRLLFGIFEALSTATLNICPTAFSKNPQAQSSPFPVQVRVRVSLECPPLEDMDPIFNDIIRARGRGRIGPLTHAQTVAIATLMAQQCGALSYMLEYQQYLQQNNGGGTTDAGGMRPPPIALPPKKIEHNSNNNGSTAPPS